MELLWSAATDKGPGRRSNGDAHAFGPLEDGTAGCWFAVVADGVGGHPAAGVASRLAVRVLRRNLRSAPSGPGPGERLARAAAGVHQALLAAGARQSEWAGMSTTLTAALIAPERLFLAHVGDSRAYLIRPDRMELLTRDHSLVGSLVRMKAVSEDEALNHPARHLLMAALGAGDEEPAVETAALAWQPEAVLMLCTDGLVGAVTAARLAAAARELLAAGPFAKFAPALVQRANGWGSEDNVTVVACRRNRDGDR